MRTTQTTQTALPTRFAIGHAIGGHAGVVQAMRALSSTAIHPHDWPEIELAKMGTGTRGLLDGAGIAS